MLSSNDFPGSFSPCPSSPGIGSARFAFVVLLEAQNSTVWRKGPCSPAAGTFYTRDTALLKTLERNLHIPRKRAFVRCGGRRLRLLPRSCKRSLLSGDRRWDLLLFIRGRDLGGSRLTLLCRLSSLSLICFNARRGSIDNPERIMAQHEQLCGALQPLDLYIRSLCLIRPFQSCDHELHQRSEERRVGKECRSRWSPY